MLTPIHMCVFDFDFVYVYMCISQYARCVSLQCIVCTDVFLHKSKHKHVIDTSEYIG